MAKFITLVDGTVTKYDWQSSSNFEHCSSDSLTEPDQSFTVQQLYARWLRGAPLPGSTLIDRDGYKDDDFNDYDPLNDSSDLVDFHERAEYERQHKIAIDRIEKEKTKKQLEKERLDLEAKLRADIEAEYKLRSPIG